MQIERLYFNMIFLGVVIHLVIIHWTVHLITFAIYILYLVKKMKKWKLWPQGIYSLVGKEMCELVIFKQWWMLLLHEKISVEAPKKRYPILGFFEKILRGDDTIPEF